MAADQPLFDTGDEFELLQNSLADSFGAEDDSEEKLKEKMQNFTDELGDCNFYTYSALMLIDPEAEFETFRSQLKMILLPCFQLLVPFGMAWYFLVTHQLITTNGYCCDNTDLIFRFTGFVTFMYSAWQIIDGSDDSAAKYLLTAAVEQWSKTGQRETLKQAWLFYMGFVSQQICCMLLLIVTYVIYTSQCDTPLDLLMNCVAINFVLDIDSEWMDDSKQDKCKDSVKYMFKEWRDACKKNPTDVRKTMQEAKQVRKKAIGTVNFAIRAGDTLVWVSAYLLVLGWTFCPPTW